MRFNFMAREIELDEDLLYYLPLDYWVKINKEEGIVTFGLTPTGNIREGGYRSLEFMVEQGEEIGAGDVIAFAITGKIKYLESIVGGTITALNKDLEKEMVDLANKQLSSCWLITISTGNPDALEEQLADLQQYRERLEIFERHTVPPGSKWVSPTCRSVYEAIRKQGEKL